MTGELPPLWVVSLQRSTDRRAAFSENMQTLGVAFEFCNAVDGRNLSPEHRAKCDPSQMQRALGRQLTDSEIGACLSHLELYRRQIAEGHDIVMICEDDAAFEPGTRTFIEQALQLAGQWDVLHLHDGGRLYPPVFSRWGQKRIAGHTLVRPTTPIDGAYGYLLHRSGAMKLLRQGFPVRLPLDALTGGTVHIGLRLYGVKPPLVTEGRFTSTLADAYAQRAAIDAEAAQKLASTPMASRALRFLRERLLRFYQRVSPWATMKLVK